MPYVVKKNKMEISKKYINDIVYQVNGAAIEVHKCIGPGLLESVYHKCLLKELSLRNIKFETEKIVAVNYKGMRLDTELRCDLFIENILPVELKAVESILPVHEAQILTYMKLLNAPKGLLINFNVTNIYNKGQKTFVNELYRELK